MTDNAWLDFVEAGGKLPVTQEVAVVVHALRESQRLLKRWLFILYEDDPEGNEGIVADTVLENDIALVPFKEDANVR